ncbi:MAG: o-succinylbenzoate synthase, partial [Acidimicrobiales bacterium]|nr:o-succinylbenzoate synthase [Acidimicrobiales bacterium]
PGFDTDVARQVRSSYPHMEIYLDANGSYGTLSQALEAFIPMDDFGITLIEQPFSPDEIVLSTRLCGHIATPICLDESLTSPTMARTLIELGACDIVSVKVGRLGGITQVMKLHEYCEEMGVKGWIGGTFSSSLGRCVDIVCAGLEHFSLSSDIALPTRGLDISENDLLDIVDGSVTVPNNVGLGQELSPESFAGKIIAKHEISL